jgi:DNA-directed RNA polymerase specialized sigma subunit
VNLRGKESELPPPAPRKAKANLAQKAVAELQRPRSCAELAESLEISGEEAQQLLDKLAENGAVLLLRDGTYRALSPAE